MNYEEIVARIKNGENPETIVKEFTDNINKAQVQIAEEEAAKTIAESERETKLTEIATTIANALQEYLTLIDIDVDGLAVEEVRALLDEFAPLFNSVKNLKVKVIDRSSKTPSSADDTIFRWLKNLGW